MFFFLFISEIIEITMSQFENVVVQNCENKVIVNKVIYVFLTIKWTITKWRTTISNIRFFSDLDIELNCYIWKQYYFNYDELFLLKSLGDKFINIDSIVRQFLCSFQSRRWKKLTHKSSNASFLFVQIVIFS